MFARFPSLIRLNSFAGRMSGVGEWQDWRQVRGALIVDPKQIHNETMPVTLSVKNVPEKLAERLRQRATSHHRSLQGELLAILEAAAQPTLTIGELAEKVKALDLRRPSESTAMIRADRDGRRR